jgi:HPt (histidine-containing phosphotransfer) domain-containing protein
LRALHEQARYEEGERLAHTIKGVAATLGAENLRDVADAIELAYHAGNAEKAATFFEPFASALHTAVVAAASLIAAPVKTSSPVSEMQEVRILQDDERKAIVAQLVSLRADIASNSMKARKSFVPVSSALQHCGVDAELQQLGSALEQLTFPTALACVDGLVARFAGKE